MCGCDCGCMAQATTTTKIDEKGRTVIGKAVREKLGIDGEECIIELEVRVDE